MKKILLLLTLTLFIVSCSDTQYVCPDGNVVLDATECETNENTKLGTSPYDEVIKDTKDSTSPATQPVALNRNEPLIQEILEKASKVENVEYDLILEHEKDKRAIHVYSNRDKMRMLLREDNTKVDDIDTVIISLSPRHVIAYCESELRCETQGEYGQVNFETYFEPTPFTWINEMNGAKIEGEEQLQNRKVVKVTTSQKHTIWVDTHYGIPLKVLNETHSYEYENMLFNKVKDTDLEFSMRE